MQALFLLSQDASFDWLLDSSTLDSGPNLLRSLSQYSHSNGIERTTLTSICIDKIFTEDGQPHPDALEAAPETCRLMQVAFPSSPPAVSSVKDDCPPAQQSPLPLFACGAIFVSIHILLLALALSGSRWTADAG